MRYMILLSYRSSRLHRIPFDEFCRLPVLSGKHGKFHDSEQFLDLESGQDFHLPPASIAQFLLDDNEVRNALSSVKAAGLRVSEGPALTEDSASLPLYGNLIDPTWLSLSLGGQCDSRCIFCFTEWIRHGRGLTKAQIIRAIDEGASVPGLEGVVFTGGEPTLRSDLLDCVSYARSRSLTVSLQTNGHRLADPKYLKQLKEAGVSEVLLSLHGSRFLTHDRIARHAGSFNKVYAALTHLEAEDNIATTINFVVCAQNLTEAESFVDFVHESGFASTLRFSFPIIEGEAYDQGDSVVPSIDQFVEYVLPAVRRALSLGLDVSVANVPGCVSRKIGVPPEYLLSQRRSMMGVSPFVSRKVLRGEISAKLALCRGCHYEKDCDGFQVAYLRDYEVDAELLRSSNG